MPPRRKDYPTEAELSILQILWQRGPSTVRQVCSHLHKDQSVGYTTVLKMMQLMLEKGLLVRDEANRAHVYSAATSEEKTQMSFVSDLLERVFHGSATQLVLKALSTKRASAEEIDQIRHMIDEMAGDKK